MNARVGMSSDVRRRFDDDPTCIALDLEINRQRLGDERALIANDNGVVSKRIDCQQIINLGGRIKNSTVIIRHHPDLLQAVMGGWRPIDPIVHVR